MRTYTSGQCSLKRCGDIDVHGQIDCVGATRWAAYSSELRKVQACVLNLKESCVYGIKNSLARGFMFLNHDILNTHRMRAWKITKATNKARTPAAIKKYASRKE